MKTKSKFMFWIPGFLLVIAIVGFFIAAEILINKM